METSDLESLWKPGKKALEPAGENLFLLKNKCSLYQAFCSRTHPWRQSKLVWTIVYFQQGIFDSFNIFSRAISIFVRERRTWAHSPSASQSWKRIPFFRHLQVLLLCECPLYPRQYNKNGYESCSRFFHGVKIRGNGLLELKVKKLFAGKLQKASSLFDGKIATPFLWGERKGESSTISWSVDSKVAWNMKISPMLV